MSAERSSHARVDLAQPQTYHTVPRLQRRTSRSFAAEDAAAIEAYLLDGLGFVLQPGRSEHERSRLISPRLTEDGRPKSMAIVYHNGSVVVQGAAALALAEHLAEFCEVA
jgi:hypothetical protein